MIRLASPSDLDRVEEIYGEILSDEDCLRFTNWQPGKYPCRNTAERALEKGWLYVMEEGGTVVAAAVLNKEQLPEYDALSWSIPAEREEVFVIHTLCVPPSCAGRGHARRFVAFSEELGRQQG